MALSPNAPDYVSAVRGVISDLRQNYLQKQQLSQQAQQAQAQIGLGYAQLAAQRENNAAQRDLQASQIDNQRLQYQNELAKYDSQLSQKSFSDQLAVSKFNFDLEKEKAKQREEARKRELEENSAVMQSELEIALDSGDPQRIMQASQKASNVLQSSATLLNVQKAAKEAIATKRKFEMDTHNLNTNDAVYSLAGDIARTPVGLLTANDFQNILGNARQRFAAIGNTDPEARKTFEGSLTALTDQFQSNRKDKSQQSFRNYYQNGIFKNLGEDQETFNKILSAYPAESRETSAAFQDEVTQAAMLFNKKKTSQWADAANKQNMDIYVTMQKRFPDQPIIPPPVFSANDVGEDLTTDPMDGTVTVAAQKANQAWRSSVSTKPGATDMIASLMNQSSNGMGAPVSAPQTGGTKTVQNQQPQQSPFSVLPLQDQQIAEALVLAPPNKIIKVKGKDGNWRSISAKEYADERFKSLGGYAGLINYKNLKTSGTGSDNVAGAKD
jgi:hypothetical protein